MVRAQRGKRQEAVAEGGLTARLTSCVCTQMPLLCHGLSEAHRPSCIWRRVGLQSTYTKRQEAGAEGGLSARLTSCVCTQMPLLCHGLSEAHRPSCIWRR